MIQYSLIGLILGHELIMEQERGKNMNNRLSLSRNWEKWGGVRHPLDKRSAFTLAEVLITLGIIGVVAAVTIPALVTTYQKRATESQLKKAYILKVALQL